MWKRIAEFWATQRVLAPLLIVGFFAAGAYTYTSLIPRDGFPELTLPILAMTFEHDLGDPGSADAEISEPVGELLLGLEGVSEFTSTATDEKVSVILFADSGADSDVLAAEANDLLSANQFETEVNVIRTDTFGFVVSLSSTEFTPAQLEDFTAELAETLEVDDRVLTANPQRQFDDEGIRVAYDQVTARNASGSFEFSPASAITIQKPTSVDSLTLSSAVDELLAEARQDGSVPDHVQTAKIGDAAEQTRDQISGLEVSLAQSLAIVAAMVLFLVGWRAAVVSVVFIPTVMATTVLVLYLFGSTLNTISMFGLLLVLGLFVDDIIVVVEAIDRNRRDGMGAVEAVSHAIERIGNADLMGSLTTIAVFCPLLFLPGLLGNFVRQLPLAVIIALATSVLFALTAFLWLAATIFAPERSTTALERGLDRVSAVGGGLVEFGGRLDYGLVSTYLRSKLATTFVGIGGVLFIAVGLGFASQLSFNIFPQPEDAPTVDLTASFANAATVAEAEQVAQQTADRIIAAVGEDIDSIAFTDTGILESAVQLTMAENAGRTSSEVAELLTTQFSDDPAVSLSAGDETASTVRFAADSLEELATLEQQVPPFIAAQPEARFAAGPPIAIAVTRYHDVRVLQVQLTMEDGESADEFLKELPERAGNDGLGIGLTADGVDSADPLTADQESSVAAMGLAFAIALVAVGLLLMLQFRSFLLPGLVLLAVPLALPLVFPGLLSVGGELSFFVMLGISALIGIAVNNSILLIDYANQEIRAGADAVSAILSALKARFRPLVTTTVTTIVGVFPLTTDEQFSGLAWTVIFGMLSSTLLVVTVFPAYYVMVQTPRSAVSRFLEARRLRRAST